MLTMSVGILVALIFSLICGKKIQGGVSGVMEKHPENGALLMASFSLAIVVVFGPMQMVSGTVKMLTFLVSMVITLVQLLLIKKFRLNWLKNFTLANALLFNCSSVFASTELRQALASAARGAAEVPDGGLYAAANGLVPDGLTVDGMNYRDTAGDVTPAAVDARALYLTARQTLTTSDFNKVSLMVPAGSGVTSAAEEINGVWQKEFSLFFSVEEVDEETFAKRLAEGDYTIALAPISAEGGSVYNMLNQFTAAGGSLTGYADSLYATQLQASTQATGSSRCRLLGDCERQLLSNAVAVPLFAQQKRLLIAPGIQNLIFDPFGPVLDLTYTTKE